MCLGVVSTARVLDFVTTQNVQNCWVYGLCPSSGKHNVSETGSVSVLR
jgi:hypothetical protein